MFKALIIGGLVFYGIALLTVWCICAAAGRADRWSEERAERERQLNADNWWHE